MTAYRRSFVFCKEREFGKGHPTAGEFEESKWIKSPPGAFISFNMGRNVQLIRSTGNKTWDEAAYGQFSGTFETSFPLDYRYPELLIMAFEGYEYDSQSKMHRFSKKNNRRIGSGCIRCKQLNEIAGGPENSDECIELRGVVIRSVSFSMSSSTSMVNVSINGAFASAGIMLDDLDRTDYEPFDDTNQVQWSCLTIDDEYMALVDSLSVNVGNSAAMQYSTCCPFAQEYFEGASSFTFSASCYSNNPDRFQLRPFAGGQKPTSKGNVYRPMTKGLKPAETVTILAYSGEGGCDNDTDAYTAITNAYENSASSMKIVLGDCVMKSMSYAKGDGGKLQDQLSSCECRTFDMFVKNDHGSSYLDSEGVFKLDDGSHGIVSDGLKDVEMSNTSKD